MQQFQTIEDVARQAQYERNPSGHIILDGQEIAATLQCCHCNRHFISIRGSGTTRAFCMCCMKVTCGNPGCDVHVAFEKKLDLYEKGRITCLT